VSAGATTATKGEARRSPRQFADGSLPNLVVIGAQKCGTSSLHRYLAKHPEIWMSGIKELNFFIAERSWSRGVEWYRRQFDPEAAVRGESSPDYTAASRFAGVPERMARVVPDAKLIFMVRDPIDRIRSQWVHNYANRVQHRPLDVAVLEDPEYVDRSSYHRQLTAFLEHYPLERVLIVEQDDLRHRRRQTLERVFAFLGVSMVWKKRYEEELLVTSQRRRKTALGAWAAERLPRRAWRRARDRAPFTVAFEQPPVGDETRAELARRLAPDARRFRELAGRAFESWSV